MIKSFLISILHTFMKLFHQSRKFFGAQDDNEDDLDAQIDLLARSDLVFDAVLMMKSCENLLRIH